jgi:hypothetical protein
MHRLRWLSLQAAANRRHRTLAKALSTDRISPQAVFAILHAFEVRYDLPRGIPSSARPWQHAK